MAICGWARNPDWPASMVSKPSRGSRQTVSNSPAILSSTFWLRATALSGLAQTRGLPVGRTASLRSIQELPVTAFIHCCKMLEERSGLRLKTRAGSVPSEPACAVPRGREFRLVRICLIRGPQRQSVGLGSNGSVAMGAWFSRALPTARGRSGRTNYSKTTTVHS